MNTTDPVLVGSGTILPWAHRETAFDLTETEWKETQVLLEQAKKMLDEKYQPDDYNIGWNSGTTAGLEVAHSHMHVIPRFIDGCPCRQGHPCPPQATRKSPTFEVSPHE